MRPKTSGNPCARPISPTGCSKATPTFAMPARKPGKSCSTRPAESPPSPPASGQSSVKQYEGWYYPQRILSPLMCSVNASENRHTARLGLRHRVLTSSLREQARKQDFLCIRGEAQRDRAFGSVGCEEAGGNQIIEQAPRRPFRQARDAGHL